MHARPDPQLIARQIQAAQDQASQIAPLTQQHAGYDLPQAYAAAQALHGLRLAAGARAAGRKIGFTNAAIWPTYGVYAPIWGPMYEHTLRALDGTPARCSLGRFAEPRIEPEIALRLCRTPPPGAQPLELLACVDQVAHGFEIVQSHFAGWKFQAADTVADGGLHGALLLGPPQPVARLGPGLAAALETLTLTLYRDGQLVDQGRGANALGSPLAALAHLVALLAAQPEAPPLQAGEWVTTGTLTAAFPVAPGQRWHTALQGIALPGLDVEFTA